jgi:hypothetical protein
MNDPSLETCPLGGLFLLKANALYEHKTNSSSDALASSVAVNGRKPGANAGAAT